MTPEEIEKVWRDEQNWKMWTFYYCKSDPRIVVPRRWKSLGWSLNYAHPGVVPFILFIFAILFVPPFIAYLQGYGKLIRGVIIAFDIIVIFLLIDYLSSPGWLKIKLSQLNKKEKSQQNIQD